MADRCISASVEAGIKGTVKCITIGHAAGTAAAMAVADGKLPRQLDVHKLKSLLRHDGLIPKKKA